jgi:hypothetical protein
MKEELKKEWEREFENKFGNLIKYHVEPDNTGGMIVNNIKSFIQQTLDTQRSELISQIKGIGCEEGGDLVTIAKVINRLNGQE